MNSKKTLITIGIIFIIFCFAGCGKKPVDNAEAYGNIIADLGDEEAYAFLVMDTDNHVLVTSNLIYDTGTEKQAATCCNVYYYFSGEPKNLGSIVGEGTAYPLTFSECAIYAASNHSVEKYTVSDKDGLMHLECGIYEKFDETGNASYTSVKGEEETVSTEAEYLDLMNEYAKSQIIHFSYGAQGCMNEIMKETAKGEIRGSARISIARAAGAEIISYNRANLERIEQNESRQQNRQTDHEQTTQKKRREEGL